MKRERGMLRVVSRLSRLIYQLIAASFLGKLFTSYIAVNRTVTGARSVILRKKEHAHTPQRHTLRRALACAMEQNLLSRAIRRVLGVLNFCNLRTFGFFFTVTGALWVALYGVSLFVSLGEIVTWVHLVSGGVCLAVGILLLFSDRSLGATLYGSALVGALLFSLLGVPDDMVKDAPSRGRQHYLMASVLSLPVAAIGLWVSPLSLLLITCSLLLVLTVLSVPEAGFLLALFFLPFSRLLVGSYFLVFAFLVLMLLGYFGKLLRGNRTFRVEWQDIPVLLMILLFAVSLGTLAEGRVWQTVLLEILLSLSYLAAVNILAAQRWLVSLRTGFVVSAALSALVGAAQLFMIMTVGDSNFSLLAMPPLGKYVTAGFADHVSYAYYLVLAFAFALPMTVHAPRRYRMAFVLMTALIAGGAVLTFVSVSWLAMVLILPVFLLIYDYRTMPFVTLTGTGVTCALLLVPTDIKTRVFSVFRDLTGPAYQAARAEGKSTLGALFFGQGEGFFSQSSGLLRFLCGSGHGALATLHPYFSQAAAPFAYTAYNHWQVLCVDYGLGGALVFGGFLLVLLQNCFSVLAADPENRPEAAFIGIALVGGMAFFSVFYYVWYDMAALAVFFLASAMTAAAMRYRRRCQTKIAHDDPGGTLRAELDYTVRLSRAKKTVGEG